jgi:hypothetical protein
MVFNATFNNISAMTCLSELLVEETGVPGEKHIPAACHWQTLSHNAVSSYLNMEMTIVFIVVLHLAVIVLVCFFLSFKCSCIEDRLIFLTKYHVKQKGTNHNLIYLALSRYTHAQCLHNGKIFNDSRIFKKTIMVHIYTNRTTCF